MLLRILLMQTSVPKTTAAPESAEMSSNVSLATALCKQCNNMRIKTNYIKWSLPKHSLSLQFAKVGNSDSSQGLLINAKCCSKPLSNSNGPILPLQAAFWQFLLWSKYHNLYIFINSWEREGWNLPTVAMYALPFAPIKSCSIVKKKKKAFWRAHMGFCVYYIYHDHNMDSASRLKKCHLLSEMQQRRQMVRSNSHHWWCPVYVRSLTPRRVQLTLLYSCKVKSRHAIAHKRSQK